MAKYDNVTKGDANDVSALVTFKEGRNVKSKDDAIERERNGGENFA